MNRFSMGTRIAVALTLLSTTVLLLLRTVGLFQDGHKELMQARTRLCESVAVSSSEFLSHSDQHGVNTTLAALVARNDEVLSAAYRDAQGDILFSAGPHNLTWQPLASGSKNCIFVPVFSGNELSGQVETAFEPLIAGGFWGFLTLPSIQVVMVATVLNLIAFGLCLRRCFRFLDPSRAVPDRVRSALDTIAEGLLVLDDKRRVVMVNKSFASMLDSAPEKLQGLNLSELPWAPNGTITCERRDGEETLLQEDRDWAALLMSAERADANDQPKLHLESEGREAITFFINSATIHDDEQRARGMLVSLNDVSVVERKNSELQAALETLRKSQEEIKQQNERLHFLATRDPLTSCLNRRSFFKSFDEQWKAATRYDFPLSCIMTDIDHFKSINDNHGHAMGDEVLKKVSAALLDAARETDYVCRYGGEEFCILLPHIDLAGAQEAGERYRHLIEGLEFEELSVTCSVGVSALSLGADEAEKLVEQADKALYVAKRTGRNRVVSFDAVADDLEVAQNQVIVDEPPQRDAAVEVPGDGGMILQLVESLAAEATDVSEQSEQINQICQTLIELVTTQGPSGGQIASLSRLAKTTLNGE